MKKYHTHTPRVDAVDRVAARRTRKIAIHLGCDPDEVSRTKDADLRALITRHEAERLRLVHNVREVRLPMRMVTLAPVGFTGFDGDAA